MTAAALTHLVLTVTIAAAMTSSGMAQSTDLKRAETILAQATTQPNEDQGQPGGMMDQGMMPEGMTPQQMAPGQGMQQRMMPEGGAPEGMMPQRNMPDRMMGRMARLPMLKIMFAVIDTDEDGSISFQELTSVHKRIFDAIDTNKDGKVTLEEIEAFMQN